jgi:hypothetical protein
MNSPQPMDLGRLKSILSASKAVMNKVETNNFTTGHIDTRALTEDGVKQLQSEGVVRPATQNNSPLSYTEDMVKNSNLPPVIKQAMLEHPIPKIGGPNHTFTLDDVSELVDEKPMGLPKRPTTRVQTINEGNNYSDTITINNSQLNEIVEKIVNQKLLEFFTKTYNKTLTEQAVKTTLNSLIKEGKIHPKKKTI